MLFTKCSMQIHCMDINAVSSILHNGEEIHMQIRQSKQQNDKIVHLQDGQYEFVTPDGKYS